MNDYFSIEESIYSKNGGDIISSIKAIAGRYMGINPAHGYVYRVYNEGDIPRTQKYQYIFDLDSIFPGTPNDSVVYAAGQLWTEKDASMALSISCYSPTIVYCNGERVFKSNAVTERYKDMRTGFNLNLKSGYNSIVLRFSKIQTGFGAMLGPGSFKSNPLCFLKPSSERSGEVGFIYTMPMPEPTEDFKYFMPKSMESATGYVWLPEYKYWEADMKNGNFSRIYGDGKDGYGIAMSKISFDKGFTHEYRFTLETLGASEVYISKEKVFTSDSGGKFDFTYKGRFGTEKIIVKCDSNSRGWGFSLESEADLDQPFPVYGTSAKWFFLGVFSENAPFNPERFDNTVKLYDVGTDGSFWRIDSLNAVIRPYNDNQHFGRWNYPLGVTLYGLMSSADIVGDKDMAGYVASHIRLCLDSFRYAMWDKEKYKACGIHNLLATLDSLDDCGSFGSAVLEMAKYAELEHLDEVSSYVADYIFNKQARLEDGTFYRYNPENQQMNKTMWADDLYMSVPFLCRYYKKTGDVKYIDDAARQLLNQYKYLFRPKKKIMSHVYDVMQGMPTEVSWGRGNGWVLFSFAELLEKLPDGHEKRGELLDAYKTLCEGYLNYQDSEGMWHQVVDDWESYRETSCTSMFAYAFAKGVKNGWLADASYAQAALKAWGAMSKISVDYMGNVYGVCRGSGYSFTKNYYKHELSWILNDTHGTGIVMLCGVEIWRMLEKLNSL